MEIWITIVGAMLCIGVGALLSWIIENRSHAKLLRRLKDDKDRTHVSLSEEFLLTEMLAKHIQDAGYAPEVIFAVSPGGSMVGEWLSRRFLGNCDEPVPLYSIWVQTERTKCGLITDRATVKDDVLTIRDDAPAGMRVLLVTDICRGGKTLKAAYSFLEDHLSNGDIKTATLFRHDHANVELDFVVAPTEKSVRFDWKE